MELLKNAHTIKPAPYAMAVLLSSDCACECEKYVTKPPRHWHCVTLQIEQSNKLTNHTRTETIFNIDRPEKDIDR